MWRPCVPLGQRIFGEISSQIRKARSRYKDRTKTRNKIISSINKPVCNHDERSYAEVEIQGQKLKDLLDSGASVCVLGRGARELVDRVDGTPISCHTSVITASGSQHQIQTKILLPVNEILFYICPSLDQQMYLGVHF